MADIVRCDGMTVDPSVLENREGISTPIFSREKPRQTDVANLWVNAIRGITSPDLTLRTPLGQHLRVPPGHQQWFSSMDESQLFHELKEDRWAVYLIPTENMVTRTPQYEWAYSMVGEHTHQKLVSVTLLSAYVSLAHRDGSVCSLLPWCLCRSSAVVASGKNRIAFQNSHCGRTSPAMATENGSGAD